MDNGVGLKLVARIALSIKNMYSLTTCKGFLSAILADKYFFMVDPPEVSFYVLTPTQL